MMKLNSISDVIHIPVQRIIDERGIMTVVSNIDLPFEIVRIFTISSINSQRGFHAHKKCNQFIVCVEGSLRLIVDDCHSKEELILDNSSDGVFIPNGIWSHQVYLNTQTLINVYCDKDYEENDYIRDYDEYKEFRSK